MDNFYNDYRPEKKINKHTKAASKLRVFATSKASQIALLDKDGKLHTRSPGFMDKYKLIGPVYCQTMAEAAEIGPRTFVINSFEQLGIMDPFCFEKHVQREDEPDAFQLPETPYQDIYPESRLNDPECSPSEIYIPRKEIMFKLMRACIKVKNVKHLWFNADL